MKKLFTTTGIVLLVLFTLAPRGAPAAGPEASDYRKYAPSRGMDILHFALDVTPDFKQRTVSGSATLKFKPIAQPLAELRLDGIDLEVSAVTSSEKSSATKPRRRKSSSPLIRPCPSAGLPVSPSPTARSR